MGLRDVLSHFMLGHEANTVTEEAVHVTERCANMQVIVPATSRCILTWQVACLVVQIIRTGEGSRKLGTLRGRMICASEWDRRQI